jgi:hypothetical protein
MPKMKEYLCDCGYILFAMMIFLLIVYGLRGCELAYVPTLIPSFSQVWEKLGMRVDVPAMP